VRRLYGIVSSLLQGGRRNIQKIKKAGLKGKNRPWGFATGKEGEQPTFSPRTAFRDKKIPSLWSVSGGELAQNRLKSEAHS